MHESTERRLSRLSADQRGALLAGLRARRAAEHRAGRVLPVDRSGPLPLSFAQQRLWFMHQWADSRPIYNTPLALRLHGPLDTAALRCALRAVVGRHSTLRTNYLNTAEGPRQIVRPPADSLLSIVDLSAVAADEREVRAAEVTAREGSRPFDLGSDPMLRATLIRLADDDHILVLAMHHIATDGWSTEILTRELIECYAAGGVAPTLPELLVQYGDYAVWQHSAEAAAGRAAALDYWRGRLAGLSTLELPADRPRPASQTWAGDTVARLIPAHLSRDLVALGGGRPVRVLPLALAGLAGLFSRYTGQDDIVVGTAFSGRTRPELEPLIGYFANTVVLRTSTAGDPSFRELLARAGEVVFTAHARQDMPFEQLVSELRPERDPTRNPLFQVALLQVSEQLKPVRMGEIELVGIPLHTGTSRFDCTLSVAERAAGGIELNLEFATELFHRDRMERLLGHLHRLLESAVSRPDAPLHDLDLLTAPEREQLAVCHDTAAPATTSGGIGAEFDAQAAATPAAVAVVHRDTQLTYAQLTARANRIAHRLRRLGAGPGALVGICLPRSADMVAALLGVLKTGAGYVPLDPAYPAARLGVMLTDAQPVAVLVDTGSRHQLTSAAHRAGYLPALVNLSEALEDEPDSAPAVIVSGELPAYVIYTSGSTGTPKGVVVSHEKVLNLFADLDQRIGAEHRGSWLAVSSMSFDISVIELLWTLTRGFTVVVAEAAAHTIRSGPRRTTVDFGLFYFASDDGSAPGRDRYRLLLEGARFADRRGFSAVWTPERHFHAFGGLYPAPSVTAAAIAMVTSRISIRAGSVVLPLHHPVRVAEEWSVLDNLSDGRVGISFASGWHQDDFVFAPGCYADRKKIMMDGIETLRALWRGETVRLPGGGGSDVDVGIRPSPVQPELPIWLSAAGSPETFRAAGAAGAGLLTHLLGQDLDDLAAKIALYRQAWRERHGSDGGHVVLMLHTFLDPDREHALRTARGPFTRYLSTSLDLLRVLGQRMGIEVDHLTEQDRQALLEHAADRYLNTGGLFGTPEDAVAFVTRLSALGIDEIACLVDFGIDEDTTLAALAHLDTVRRAFTTEDASLAELIRQHRVTHLQCTPTMAGLLAADPSAANALAGLDVLLVGGEAMPTDLAARLRAVTGARLHNMYGPTETTIWSTAFEVTDVDEDLPIVPIGGSLRNTTARVLDRWLTPQPVGIPGELYLGGAGVSDGYHRRPGLTATRFLPDPFGAGGGRLYRTGDVVRRRADGRLEFLGRADDQVKIRGHRLELGEVEAVLAAHPTVRQAVVAPRGELDQRVLAAYLVPADGDRPSAADLSRHLRDRLPTYMIPARFAWLNSLPVSPNGKVDRTRLPEPDATSPRDSQEPPSTPVQHALAEVWQEVLGIEAVGIRSNFFDLGGNSISVVLVVDKANRRGLPVTARQVFQHQSIAELAEILDDAHHAAEAGLVMPLRTGGALPPLVCLHASTGSSLPYVPLSQHLAPDQPCYAIELTADTGGSALSADELAQRYAAAIRAQLPAGLVHLAGWSIGGGLAFAVACLLRAQGHPVGLVALLDTPAAAETPRQPSPAAALEGFVQSVALAAGRSVTADIPATLEPEQQYTAAMRCLDRAGLVPAGQHEELLARARVFVALTIAAAQWVPQRYPGDVHLLMPVEADSSDVACAGWQRSVEGQLRVIPVPGNHFSMMRQDNAPELGATLTELIRRANDTKGDDPA